MTAPARSPYLIAPPVATPMVAQSTVAIEAQASTLASTSVTAQDAVVTYLLATGLVTDGETWYDTDTVTQMAEGAADIVDAFADSVARSTDAFIADTVENLSGKKYRAIGLRKTLGIIGEHGVRNGVTTAGVIGRSADTYRYQQSKLDKQFIADVAADLPSPTELASPLDVALERVRRGTQLNIALAARNQAQATMAEAGKRGLITGYRRVLHAELSHKGSCGLCVAASTEIYHASHLMPLHPGCHCVPVPIGPNRDPGGAINDRDLERFYRDAGGTSAEKLRETRYKVDSHGEIGPVLRPFGDPIRTQQQARRDTNRHRPSKSTAQQVATLRNRRDQLARSLGKVAQTDPAWARKADDVRARIAHLESQIIKLEAA